MRPTAEYRAVQDLLADGHADREIERVTGVPRSTVAGWRRGDSPRHRRWLIATPEWRPSDHEAYSYLLGLYLGDGNIVTKPSGSAFLRITLDAQYEGIVQSATRAIQRVLPDTRVRRYEFDSDRRLILQASHPVLPFAFPQHGRGRKHLRPIELASWQRAITGNHPCELLRGLIHSDGCRTTNRFSVPLPSGRVGKYEYARYFFSNLSDDIRGIFCDHCDLLGIRWTQSNPRNISISSRASVALLDSFIGPKA